MKIRIVLVAITFLIAGYLIGERRNDIEHKAAKPNHGYVFKDDLSCVVQYSTSKDEPGRHISLLRLSSNEPAGLFSRSGGTSPLKKLFEDEDVLVLQLIASATGSVDTFHLNKKTGVFTRLEAGDILRYATVSKGACE